MEITADSALVEVAAIVSDALQKAGITAILSGGSAVTIYANNRYLSEDLDFVTAAMISELKPVLSEIGFVHTGVPRLSQFEHPLVEWYLEFPSFPLMFGNLHANPQDCAVIELPVGNLRIITPTQSVMDRLAATYAWNDAQARDQAIMVAAAQEIDWEALRTWFEQEGVEDTEFLRFREAVDRRN